MGASRLSIYNGALRYLQERKLASLTENREPRRYMDDEFDGNNLFCLSQGNWTFALNQVELQASTTLIPNFSLAYAFPIPGDLDHIYQLADNESYNPLLRTYTVQNNIIYADISPIYLTYVSNGPNYGLNLGLWTPPFIDYVQARLAWLCVPRLKQKQETIDAVTKIMKDAKATAVNKDSQGLPPGQTPYGTWVQSRAPRGSITPLGNPYAGSTS